LIGLRSTLSEEALAYWRRLLTQDTAGAARRVDNCPAAPRQSTDDSCTTLPRRRNIFTAAAAAVDAYADIDRETFPHSPINRKGPHIPHRRNKRIRHLQKMF